MRFRHGCRDGIPIMLGYLTVSFTFGVNCVAKGFTWWMPLLCSVTNYTGTGQFAGMELIAAAGSVIELIATMLVINARYALMGVSLSQKLDKKTHVWQRLIIAFGLTDENYAVSMRQSKDVTFEYFLGVSLTAYAGWIGGTLLGALAGNVLPESLLSAFGIALYAMFIAIVIPPCRTSKAVLTVVLTAVATSCLFYYVPGLNNVSSGWSIIICGILSSAVGAVFFPIHPSNEQTADQKNTDGVVFGNPTGATVKPVSDDLATHSGQSAEKSEKAETGEEKSASDTADDGEGGEL